MEPTFEELLAQSIGLEVLKYLTQTNKLEELAEKTESEAIQTLAEMKTILNDETLDDAACFRRIDAIVDAFHRHGLSTNRHDFRKARPALTHRAGFRFSSNHMRL